MIYERIAEYCKEKHITLSEFEKQCKIGNGTVGKWKDDRMQPSLKTLNKISAVTGVAIGYWIGGVK